MKLYIGYSSFCVILELRKDIPKVNNAHNPFMLERRFSYETSFCHPASAMVFAFAACSSSNDAPASQGTTEQEVATDEEKEEPAADATEEKPVEPEQPTDAEDAQQQTITGTIVESAEDTVTIQTEDGQELTFSLSDDTDRSQTDSLLAGTALEVIYTGAIDGSDTSNVTVVQLVETGAEAE